MKINFNIFGKDSFTVFDTETTGLDTDYDLVAGKPVLREGGTPCNIIEVASMSFKNGKYNGFSSDICKPENNLPVSPIAASTHGYTNKMLLKEKSFDKIKATKDLVRDIKAGHFIIAHNMRFDLNMLRIHGIDIPEDQCIDTLIVARHVFKDGLFGLENTEFYKYLNETAPENHQLQYFRYLMEMDDQDYFQEAMDLAGLTEIKPHTALSDVAILWIFLIWIANKTGLTLKDMVDLTRKPVLQRKFTYGQKWRIRDLEYRQIIRSEFPTPWGTMKKGYEEFIWPFENGGMMADVEYSIIHTMGHGILDGVVPYSKGKQDYKQFLPLAVKYCFNEEEIKRALVLMGKDLSFLQKLWTNSEKKVLEQMNSPIDTTIHPEEFDKYISQRENRAFLHRYAELYRKDMILNIKED